jgi:TPR repeat protein
MPEVPSNMQEGLAHLELEARNPPTQGTSSQSTVSSVISPTSVTYQQSSHAPDSPMSSISQRTSGGPGLTASYPNTNAAAYKNLNRANVKQLDVSQPDSPRFSPFPKPRDAGNNVPPSDDEKEEVLERVRPLVLQSTDPEQQLAWAQDTLTWVEASQQNSNRQNLEGQPARSTTPRNERSLRVDAINIVSFLAEQGHPRAEFMKGMWLEFGKFGCGIDKREAFLAYKRAAAKGYARAEYRIGMQYESGNTPEKAKDHYNKGVAQKDSASNYRLGMMTLLGQHDTPQNYQRGVNLIRFAADTSDENAPQGAYVYGMLLARELPNISIPDQFLPYDLSDAKLFIEKAAYLGFAKAQLKMAQAYELCQLNCDFDPALSLHYNALASRQGEAEADMAISKWFLCGFEGIFEKNEELAYTYAKRAAQTKMPTAEFAMGYFYEIGMYVPIDLQESESWYQKAANHGNKDALSRIESIKKNNTLSKSDHEKVAISRIKSMYGSQRGARPDRFKQRANPMVSMPEERVDMPDPRNSYAGSGAPQLRIQSTNPLPPRPVSTAPYPEDDLVITPGIGSRPYSNQGLRPVGPQADRPSSAFGIRPLHHSATDSYDHQPRTADVQRPSSSMGNMSVPNGRGHNPGGRDRIVSTGWEPQLPPNNHDNSPNRQAPIPQAAPSQTSNRLQKQQPNVNKAQPQPPREFPMQQPYPSDSSRKSLTTPMNDTAATTRRDPAKNKVQLPPRGSSMTPVASSPFMVPQSDRYSSIQNQSLLNDRHSALQSPPPFQNDRYSSIQNQSQSPVVSVASSRTSQRPSQHTMSSQRPDSQTSTPTNTHPPGGQPPKRQGPATFDEMGIPHGKNDSDCVSMILLHSLELY